MFQRLNKRIIQTSLLLALIFLAACTSSGTETLTPTITPTLVPTATDVPTLQASITPEPPTVTPTATLPTTFVAPVTGERIEPPIDISLPSGWRQGFNAMVIADIDALRAVPVAIYSGSVTGGTGFIVLFWNFPLLLTADPFETVTLNEVMWTKGLQIFRLAVVDQGCNPGTDLKMEFTVGGKPAVGTQFSIVDCPESKDARGWFAALQELGMNFAFYAFVEPIADINSPEALQQVPVAWQELQQILDTVQFHVEDLLTVTPTP